VSATVQGTDIVQTPAEPARADLTIGNLNISVVKGFDPLTVYGGSASTLSVELRNPNNVPVSGIKFADHMPAGMIVANPSNPDVGNCGGAVEAVPGADSFSFSGGSLGPATSCVLTLRVTMTVNGNLTNIIDPGTVTTLNGASNPDPAKASLTNLPGASISKAFTPKTIKPGAVAALTFTIQNTGSVALTGMGFIDILPGDPPVGLEVADSPASVNNCGGTLTAEPGTQLIKLENGTLGLNASCTIVVHVTGNIKGTYTNTIEQGTLRSNEGATNHDSTTDTLTITPTGSNEGGTDNEGGGKKKSSKPSTAVNGFVIPVTGFQPDTITRLDSLAHPRYDTLGMTIEIPVLHVNTSIVGVQIKDGGWDVSWLQNQLGWLNGTAYPTWKGNSVLTGHVISADGKPGIFSQLKYLEVGELIFVKNGAYRYTYQVVSNQSIEPDDATSFGHEDKSYLTLITCDNYDLQSASYLSRVAVRAKLVDVRQIP
jgi:LPXTG-site transpeptidase (sortase) family protein